MGTGRLVPIVERYLGQGYSAITLAVSQSVTWSGERFLQVPSGGAMQSIDRETPLSRVICLHYRSCLGKRGLPLF